jgi:hypothetical protein
LAAGEALLDGHQSKKNTTIAKTHDINATNHHKSKKHGIHIEYTHDFRGFQNIDDQGPRRPSPIAT